MSFRLRSLLRPTALASLVMFAATPSLAGPSGHVITMQTASRIKLDGLLREWSGATFVRASYRLKGRSRSSLRVALAYDDSYLYVGAKIQDSKLVRTNQAERSEDHVLLVLSFPDGAGRYRHRYEVELYPGVPGKTAGVVKARGLGVVRGADLIEAPARRGVTFEGKIPWSLFPPAATNRLKIHAAISYHDAGAGVISTAKATSASRMPVLITEPEMSLREGLLREKHLRGRPDYDRVLNLVGDKMKERLVRYGRYVAVLGPHFRKGKEYYWLDLGVDANQGDLPLFEARDITGDSRAEVILRKRLHRGDGWRELLQVLSFSSGDVLQPIFEHETGISSSVGTIQNDVRIVGRGKSARIIVSLGQSSGYDVDSYHEPTDRDRDPLLVPWGSIKSQTYAWNGSSFVKQSEKTQRPRTSPKQTTPAIAGPPAPRAPSAEELLDKVLALYRHDHGVPARTKPKFDFVTNVAADERVERVLCFGTDLVVFGKGYQRGLGYVSLSMPQFTSARDIVDVTARDVTGDGHAEIIVRGVQRTKAPEEVGSGEFTREVLFIYKVGDQSVQRIFATETAVTNSDRRIHSLVAFIPNAGGLDIELRPGRAIGWAHDTWPYRQEDTPVSGVQPLVLPWTADSVRFHFDGNTFTR